MPVFLAKRKTRSCSGSDITSSSHYVPALLPPGVSSSVQSSLWGWGSDRHRESSKGWWQFTIQSGVSQGRDPGWNLCRAGGEGQHTRAQRAAKMRLAARASFCSKAFRKLWPRFSPVTCPGSAQGEDWRTKMAWSHLSASPLRSSWGLAAPQGRFKSPRAIVAAGDC